MQKTQKNVNYGAGELEVENSIVSTTCANKAKPTNNSSQNQGMTHYDMINLT